MDERDDPRLIRDPAQMRLLSSGVRQEMIDTLAALGGEAGVASLADQLGRPADGLYYHLRALVAGGLVEELPSNGGERRFRLVGGGDGPLRLSYDLGPNGNAASCALSSMGCCRLPIETSRLRWGGVTPWLPVRHERFGLPATRGGLPQQTLRRSTPFLPAWVN